MKTINVTSKTTMHVPSVFTMKELQKANPSVKENTLYQRVKVLLSEDSPIIVVDSQMKRGNRKGRTEITYRLVDANDELVNKFRLQGRTNVVVASITNQPDTTNAPSELTPIS